MEMHNSITDVKCKICAEILSIDNIGIHLMKEHGITDVKCKICAEVLSIDNMRTHLMKKHCFNNQPRLDIEFERYLRGLRKSMQKFILNLPQKTKRLPTTKKLPVVLIQLEPKQPSIAEYSPSAKHPENVKKKDVPFVDVKSENDGYDKTPTKLFGKR